MKTLLTAFQPERMDLSSSKFLSIPVNCFTQELVSDPTRTYTKIKLLIIDLYINRNNR